MSEGAARWGDLAPRVVTAVILLTVAVIELWLGGWALVAGVALLAALMTWELARMLAPDKAREARGMAILSFVVILAAWLLPAMVALPLFGAAALVGADRLGQHKGLYLPAAAAILVGSHTVNLLHEQAGSSWLFWIISVVIVSDVAGYFAGRLLGGPKFWPKVSPKKTWSGTIAGWIGAGVVGAVFAAPTGAGAGLVAVSVLAGLAGQMGDIGESAIKRRVSVKDSSNLLPGHGGVLDRFDAMLGAALAVGALWVLNLLPGLA